MYFQVKYNLNLFEKDVLLGLYDVDIMNVLFVQVVSAAMMKQAPQSQSK